MHTRRRGIRLFLAVAAVGAATIAAPRPAVAAPTPRPKLTIGNPGAAPFSRALDCNPTTCVGVGIGNVVAPVMDRRAGAATSAPSPSDLLWGVACPTPTSCVAVGSSGSHAVVVTIADGVPTATVELTAVRVLFGVGCTAAATCYAVGYDETGAVVVPIVNGVAGAPVAVPGAQMLRAISCAGGACEAVGGTYLTAGLPLSLEPVGMAVRIANGAVGQARPVAGTGSLNAVACRDASACFAAGSTWPTQPLCVVLLLCSSRGMAGVVVAISGGRPGAPLLVSGTKELNGIDCPSGAPAASPCIAVGQDLRATAGAIATVGGSAPSRTVHVDRVRNLFGISCGGTLDCEVIGETGTGLSDGMLLAVAFGPIDGAQAVDGTGLLQGAACATTSSCFVVGRDSLQRVGVVVPTTNGVAGRRRVAGPTWFQAISCPSATTCFAVAGFFVVPIVNGLPRPPIVIQGIDMLGISCASASVCTAVGTNMAGSAAFVSLVNGTPGTVVTLPDASVLEDVACPSATRCEAVGYFVSSGLHAIVVSIIGGVASPAVAVPGVNWLNGVACTSVTNCVAVGGFPSGVVVPLVSGVPGAVSTAAISLNGVACPTSTTCVAGGGDNIGGGVVTIVGGIVGPPRFIAAADVVFAVACSTATTCVATGFGPQVGVVAPFSP